MAPSLAQDIGLLMRMTERIEFYRCGSKFKMLASPHFGEVVEFKIRSIHFAGDKNVLVIKHSDKVVCVARHPRDFKTQSQLSDIHLLRVEQLAGDPLPRLHLIIESEVNPRAQIS